MAGRVHVDRLSSLVLVVVQLLAPGWTACPAGFQPPDCLHPCPDGRYGLGCASLCPSTCLTPSCRTDTGHCLRCRHGFKGPRCSSRCLSGHFGQDCAHTCGVNCLGRVCDAFTGACPGCQPGFMGTFCTQVDHTGVQLGKTARREQQRHMKEMGATLSGASLETAAQRARKKEEEGKSERELFVTIMIFACATLPFFLIGTCLYFMREKIQDLYSILLRKKRWGTARDGFFSSTVISETRPHFQKKQSQGIANVPIVNLDEETFEESNSGSTPVKNESSKMQRSGPGSAQRVSLGDIYTGPDGKARTNNDYGFVNEGDGLNKVEAQGCVSVWEEDMDKTVPIDCHRSRDGGFSPKTTHLWRRLLHKALKTVRSGDEHRASAGKHGRNSGSGRRVNVYKYSGPFSQEVLQMACHLEQTEESMQSCTTSVISDSEEIAMGDAGTRVDATRPHNAARGHGSTTVLNPDPLGTSESTRDSVVLKYREASVQTRSHPDDRSSNTQIDQSDGKTKLRHAAISGASCSGTLQMANHKRVVENSMNHSGSITNSALQTTTGTGDVCLQPASTIKPAQQPLIEITEICASPPGSVTSGNKIIREDAATCLSRSGQCRTNCTAMIPVGKNTKPGKVTDATGTSKATNDAAIGSNRCCHSAIGDVAKEVAWHPICRGLWTIPSRSLQVESLREEILDSNTTTKICKPTKAKYLKIKTGQMVHKLLRRGSDACTKFGMRSSVPNSSFLSRLKNYDYLRRRRNRGLWSLRGKETIRDPGNCDIEDQSFVHEVNIVFDNGQPRKKHSRPHAHDSLAAESAAPSTQLSTFSERCVTQSEPTQKALYPDNCAGMDLLCHSSGINGSEIQALTTIKNSAATTRHSVLDQQSSPDSSQESFTSLSKRCEAKFIQCTVDVLENSRQLSDPICPPYTEKYEGQLIHKPVHLNAVGDLIKDRSFSGESYQSFKDSISPHDAMDTDGIRPSSRLPSSRQVASSEDDLLSEKKCIDIKKYMRKNSRACSLSLKDISLSSNVTGANAQSNHSEFEQKHSEKAYIYRSKRNLTDYPWALSKPTNASQTMQHLQLAPQGDPQPSPKRVTWKETGNKKADITSPLLDSSSSLDTETVSDILTSPVLNVVPVYIRDLTSVTHQQRAIAGEIDPSFARDSSPPCLQRFEIFEKQRRRSQSGSVPTATGFGSAASLCKPTQNRGKKVHKCEASATYLLPSDTINEPQASIQDYSYQIKHEIGPSLSHENSQISVQNQDVSSREARSDKGLEVMVAGNLKSQGYQIEIDGTRHSNVHGHMTNRVNTEHAQIPRHSLHKTPNVELKAWSSPVPLRSPRCQELKCSPCLKVFDNHSSPVDTSGVKQSYRSQPGDPQSYADLSLRNECLSLGNLDKLGYHHNPPGEKYFIRSKFNLVPQDQHALQTTNASPSQGDSRNQRHGENRSKATNNIPCSDTSLVNAAQKSNPSILCPNNDVQLPISRICQHDVVCATRDGTALTIDYSVLKNSCITSGTITTHKKESPDGNKISDQVNTQTVSKDSHVVTHTPISQLGGGALHSMKVISESSEFQRHLINSLEPMTGAPSRLIQQQHYNSDSSNHGVAVAESLERAQWRRELSSEEPTFSSQRETLKECSSLSTHDEENCYGKVSIVDIDENQKRLSRRVISIKRTKSHTSKDGETSSSWDNVSEPNENPIIPDAGSDIYPLPTLLTQSLLPDSARNVGQTKSFSLIGHAQQPLSCAVNPALALPTPSCLLPNSNVGQPSSPNQNSYLDEPTSCTVDKAPTPPKHHLLRDIVRNTEQMKQPCQSTPSPQLMPQPVSYQASCVAEATLTQCKAPQLAPYPVPYKAPQSASCQAPKPAPQPAPYPAPQPALQPASCPEHVTLTPCPAHATLTPCPAHTTLTSPVIETNTPCGAAARDTEEFKSIRDSGSERYYDALEPARSPRHTRVTRSLRTKIRDEVAGQKEALAVCSSKRARTKSSKHDKVRSSSVLRFALDVTGNNGPDKERLPSKPSRGSDIALQFARSDGFPTKKDRRAQRSRHRGDKDKTGEEGRPKDITKVAHRNDWTRKKPGGNDDGGT